MTLGVRTGLALWMLALLSCTAAGAAEIRVLSAGALKSVLTDVIPRFERATGYRVRVDYAPAQPLTRRVLGGELADVIINSAEAQDELDAGGKTLPNTRRTLGIVGIGVAVKAGAPLPDISTESAFRVTLLKARSIAAINPERGTSGRQFALVLQRLGIADEVRPKLTLLDGGSTAESVARGEAELAVQQISELVDVPGIAIVGPLPGALQKETAYVAAVLQGAVDAEAAGRLVEFLASPEFRAAMRAKGFMAKD
jgi:molybdate transport system substrate-binding protein